MKQLVQHSVWLIVLGTSCWCSIYHDEDDQAAHSLLKKPGARTAAHLRQAPEARDAPVDACNSDDVESVSPDQTPGVCADFDLSACLCNLNSNCKFDDQSNSCVEREDCQALSQNPKQCRASHCVYDCNTGECQEEGGSASCNNNCNTKCYDVCSCRGSGCDYNIDTGTCSEIKELTCSDGVFGQNECARRNAIYYRAGRYCKSARQRGFCTREKTIVAVNLGGRNVTDRDGILYVANRHYQGIDTKKVTKKFTHPEDIPGVPASEQSLYTTHRLADAGKRHLNGCLTFEVRICEEGSFELTIKVVEFAEVAVGEKFFNIKFAGRTIFPEVDIVRLAGGRLRPLDLTVSFEYKNNHINIPGQSSVMAKNGIFRLEFCYGECLMAQSYFAPSAFSIVKLVDWRKQYQSADSCSRYHGNEMECATANCEYEGATDMCLPFYKADICDDKLCGFYEQPASTSKKFECSLYNCEVRVQLAFLVDSTEYYTSVKPVLGETMIAVRNKIISLYPNAEFAFATTANWNLEAFTTEDDHEGGHHLPEGCYQRQVQFTSDINALVAQINSVRVQMGHPGDLVEADSALPGAAFTATDTNLGWIREDRDKTGRRVYRFVLMLTDDDSLFELFNPGSRTHFLLDGTDSCTTTLPPTYSTYRTVFRTQKINVIGAYEKAELEGTYQDHFKRIRTSYCGKAYNKDGKPAEEISDIVINCLKEMTTCLCNKPVQTCSI